ncbi:MAG: acyl-CoA dehydrogenase family protein [Acidimicrobiales bacterium]
MEAARRVAEEVLAPAAEATDQSDSVPLTHMRALAAAGLSRPCPREVYEVLAGACGVSFFTWVQHHAPVRLLAASTNVTLRDRWLPRLLSGEVLGGVAFAHLRRPGPPAVAATRTGNAWRIDGEAPWVTSWGLAGVFAVAARADDRVLFALVRGEAGEHLQPSGPLRLLAMQASRTVRLRFDALTVPDGDVIAEQPFADWRARDRVVTAQPNPAAFGVAATCTRLLAAVDPPRAEALEAERLDCRAQAYGSDPSDVDRLVRLRAWSLELAQRSAYALVVATGGRAVQLEHPAQRLLREAAFYAIQAQTRPVRSATLDRLTR